MIKRKIVHTSGRRKQAIARANCVAGKGVLRFNSQILEYVHPENAKLMISEPMFLLGDRASEINVNIFTQGGGVMAQAHAARVALSRALVDYFKDAKLKEKFIAYDRKMLVSDTRQTEPQKPRNGRSAARRKRQTSKR